MAPEDAYEEIMNAVDGGETKALTEYREDGKLEMTFDDGSAFVIVAIPK